MSKRQRLMLGLVLIGLVLAVSLIDPLWPIKWLTEIAPYGNSTIAVLVLPFGPLLLLSGLKIKRVKWRGLLSMALLPHRAFYDHLLLWMLVDDWRQMVLLTALSWGAVLIFYRTDDYSITVILYLFVFLAWNRFKLSNWLQSHASLGVAAAPKSHEVF
jgi:hypothetical protein